LISIIISSHFFLLISVCGFFQKSSSDSLPLHPTRLLTPNTSHHNTTHNNNSSPFAERDIGEFGDTVESAADPGDTIEGTGKKGNLAPKTEEEVEKTKISICCVHLSATRCIDDTQSQWIWPAQ